jgi:pSer/pThr/pTyr-binding forkhead associated (FHA) protein
MAMKYLIFTLSNETRGIQIDMPLVEGYVIGRSDEALNYIPDIDLALYDSREKGVSRRHAALVNYEGVAHIIDLSSANGTYLNGKRLSPDQPYLLANFNEIRLGTLNVTITIS